MAVAGLMMLSSCAPAQGEATMPEIQAYQPSSQATAKVELFYHNPSSKLFESEIRELTVPNNATAAHVAVENLVHHPPTEGKALVPDRVEVASVTLIDKVAFVDVRYDGEEAVSFENLRKACTLTLYHLCGVEYTVLTVDGIIPKEFERGVSAVSESNTISFVLYFPTADETKMVPVVHTVEAGENAEDRLVSLMLEELKKTPANALLAPAMEQDTSVRWSVTDDVMELNLRISRYSSNLQDEFECRCFALSVLATVPGIKTVELFLNNEPVGDGSYTLEDFSDLQRACCPVYTARYDGQSLQESTQLVTFTQKNDPFCAVRLLLQGAEAGERNWVFPQLVQAEQFLGGKVEEDIAILNFSQAFYDACASLTENRERLAVYAVVNAMTQTEGINQVLFLCDGQNVQTLSGRISLLKPLLRNPGIIGL